MKNITIKLGGESKRQTMAHDMFWCRGSVLDAACLLSPSVEKLYIQICKAGKEDALKNRFEQNVGYAMTKCWEYKYNVAPLTINKETFHISNIGNDRQLDWLHSQLSTVCYKNGSRDPTLYICSIAGMIAALTRTADERISVTLEDGLSNTIQEEDLIHYVAYYLSSLGIKQILI